MTMLTTNNHTAFLFKTLHTYWACERIDIKDSENVKSDEFFLANVKINGEPPTMTWAEVQAKMDELRPQEALKKLREERDLLLDKTDRYVLPDFPHSEESRQAWMTYRQALRDLPTDSPDASIETGQLTGVVWPTKPQ